MKRVKITHIQPKSAFKAVLLGFLIPLCMFLLFSALVTIPLALSKNQFAEDGVLQMVIFIIPLLLWPLATAIVTLVFVASYNLLAPRFGGLILEVEDDNTHSLEKESR